MYSLPNLPYAYEALEPFMDTETMHIHHEKHHAAYVKNLNDALAGMPDLLNKSVNEVLGRLDVLVPEDIRTKVRNNAGGHFNHSLFWQIMCAGSQSVYPNSGALFEAINNTFGNIDIFKEKFTSASLGRFGSGWVWLVVKDNKLEIMDTPNQDSPNLNTSTIPIFGLDVWEHAYYLKYRNMRIDYVNAFWNIVNWNKVEENLQKAGDNG